MVGHDYLHSLSSSSASCPRKAGWAAKSDLTAPNAEAGCTCKAGASAEDRETGAIVISKICRLAVAARPAGPADALAQRLLQVDDVLAARPLLRHDRLAGALLVDEVDQRRFVLVLELVGLESPRLLVHDV